MLVAVRVRKVRAALAFLCFPPYCTAEYLLFRPFVQPHSAVIRCGGNAEEELVMDDFECVACGCPAVVYPRVLEDGEPVACSRCGAFVSTYGQFKARAEAAERSNWARSPVSGC